MASGEGDGVEVRRINGRTRIRVREVVGELTVEGVEGKVRIEMEVGGIRLACELEPEVAARIAAEMGQAAGQAEGRGGGEA
jgi:hypothetical protein